MIPNIDPERISWNDDGMHRTNDLTFTQVCVHMTIYTLSYPDYIIVTCSSSFYYRSYFVINLLLFTGKAIHHRRSHYDCQC